MELTVGACLMVTEGEGVVVGLCKLEEETSFGKYANAAQVGMGRACARGLREKRGRARWLAGLRGHDMQCILYKIYFFGKFFICTII
jgi:hypothetical protein